MQVEALDLAQYSVHTFLEWRCFAEKIMFGIW